MHSILPPRKETMVVAEFFKCPIRCSFTCRGMVGCWKGMIYCMVLDWSAPGGGGNKLSFMVYCSRVFAYSVVTSYAVGCCQCLQKSMHGIPPPQKRLWLLLNFLNAQSEVPLPVKVWCAVTRLWYILSGIWVKPIPPHPPELGKWIVIYGVVL